MKLRVKAAWLPRALLGGALALLWTSSAAAQGGGGGGPGGGGGGGGGPGGGGAGTGGFGSPTGTGGGPTGGTPLAQGATGRPGGAGGTNAPTPASGNTFLSFSGNAMAPGFGPNRTISASTFSSSGSSGSSGSGGGTGFSSTSATSSTSSQGFNSNLSSSGQIATLKTGSLNQPLFAVASSTTATTSTSNLGNTMGFTTVGQRRAPPYITTVGFRRGPRVTPEAMETDVRQSLARSPRLTNGQGIQVSVNGTTVVLRGTVANQRERRVADVLVRLSPGVRDVRNELKVPPGAREVGE
jgi:hypothetical protein